MILAVQKAIYARLSDQITGAEIFDFMQQKKQYPAVIIGDSLGYENDTDTENGFNETLTIHSWTSDSDSRGYSVLCGIMEQIYNALHYYDLQVEGYGVSVIYQEFSEKMRDADGLTRHGIQRFKIIYEKVGA